MLTLYTKRDVTIKVTVSNLTDFANVTEIELAIVDTRRKVVLVEKKLSLLELETESPNVIVADFTQAEVNTLLGNDNTGLEVAVTYATGRFAVEFDNSTVNIIGSAL